MFTYMAKRIFFARGLFLVVAFILGTVLNASERIFTNETILAEYRGGKITGSDFNEEFYKLPEMFRSGYATAAGRKEFLNALIINRIAYMKALELGIETDPETFADSESLLKPYFAALYRRYHTADAGSVNIDHIRQYYHENQNRFIISAATTIRYIQPEESQVRKTATALRRAERSRNSQKEDDPFKDIIERFSVHTLSKRNNGVVSNIRGTGIIPGIGKDPLLDSAISEAPLNEWVGPVSTETGFHFFRVVERVPETVRSFEEVEDDLTYYLTSQSEKNIVQELNENLMEKHQVHIDYDKLNSLRLLSLSQYSPDLKEVVVTSELSGLEITVGNLFDHFRTVSPYIVNEDITSELDYHSQIRYLSRDEWIELTSPEALNRLVNNLISVHLFDYEARHTFLSDPVSDEPELLFLQADPSSSIFDQAVFEHREIQQLRRHIVLQAFFKKLVTDPVDPTAADIKRYYEDNLNRFTTREHRAIRLFLYNNEKEALESRKRVAGIVQIQDREQKDNALKQIFASSMYRDRNGIIPFVYKDPILPRFGRDDVMYETIWNTPVGELSEVHRNQSGLFFFLQVISYDPPHTYSFSYCTPFITSLLTYDNRLDRWNELQNELLAEYNVVAYPERLFLLLPPSELFELAEQSQIRRRFQDAIHYYDQVIENHRNNEDDYNALFMKAFLLYRDMGQKQEALKHFNKLVNEYPHSHLHQSAEYMIEAILKER